ncbi:MAG: hypothetical protein ACJAV1_000163 [Paraglaciecola sp.]|jgi:hypothetical protein
MAADVRLLGNRSHIVVCYYAVISVIRSYEPAIFEAATVFESS